MAVIRSSGPRSPRAGEVITLGTGHLGGLDRRARGQWQVTAGLPQVRDNSLEARTGSGAVIAGLSDIAGNCLEDRHQGANPVADHVRGDDAGSRRAVVEGLDGEVPARPAFWVDREAGQFISPVHQLRARPGMLSAADGRKSTNRLHPPRPPERQWRAFDQPAAQ